MACPAYASAPLGAALRVPSMYRLSAEGALLSAADGELISPRPLFVVGTMTDRSSHQQLVEVLYSTAQGWRRHVVSRTAVRDSRALIAELSCIAGAPVDSLSSRALTRWLVDFVELNQGVIPDTAYVELGGWHRVADREVFVLGDTVITDGSGDPPAIELDRRGDRNRIARGLRTAGDAQQSLALLREVVQQDNTAAAAVFASLAGPVLERLSGRNFIFSLVGPSSRGKSTKAEAAASVWGCPDPSDADSWMMSWSATHVALEQRCAAACDISLVLDESALIDPRARRDAVYLMALGRGRGRGAKAGGTRADASWRMSVISTGESRLLDSTAEAGARARVLELDVHGFGNLDAAGVDRIRELARTHYGHVGRMWIEALFKENRAELLSLYKAARDACRLAVGGARATTENRQGEIIAVLVMVERLAARVLGIGDPEGATMVGLVDDAARSTQEPEGERALETVRDLVLSRRAAFVTAKGSQADGYKLEREPPPSVEVRGYWLSTTTVPPTDPTELLLLREPLSEHLRSFGQDAAVVAAEWKRLGYLGVTDRGRTTRRVSIGGERTRFIPLLRAALYPEGEDRDDR